MKPSHESTGHYSYLLDLDYDNNLGIANHSAAKHRIAKHRIAKHRIAKHRSAKKRGPLVGLYGQPFGIHHFSNQHVSSNV